MVSAAVARAERGISERQVREQVLKFRDHGISIAVVPGDGTR